MVLGVCYHGLGLCKGYEFLWKEMNANLGYLIEVIFAYAKVSIVFPMVVL
jgi:transglutaminase/protease-like cytokinesis protein 3